MISSKSGLGKIRQSWWSRGKIIESKASYIDAKMLFLLVSVMVQVVCFVVRKFIFHLQYDSRKSLCLETLLLWYLTKASLHLSQTRRAILSYDSSSLIVVISCN